MIASDAAEMQVNEASVGTFIKELDGSEQNLMMQDGGTIGAGRDSI